MSQFIYSHLQYPVEALAAGVQGRVIVDCDIDDKGEVVATRIIKSLGHGCDEEAMRVVRMLRFRVKRTRGLRVLYHKKIHIQFKLPQPQRGPVVAQSVQIQYQVVQKEPTPGKEKVPAATYEYTISW